MKMMKSGLAVCLLLCILLSGCQSIEKGTAENNNTKAPITTEDPSDARLEYYEQLVSELQKELLDLKAALYVSRTEYEELENRFEAIGGQNTVSQADFQYRVENGEAVVTGYLGRSTTVEIPETLGGYRVCAVGDSAFASQTRLTSVEIPEGVRQIGWFAFSGCVMLEKVTLPESVTSIDYGAFEHCKSNLTVTCKDGSYACLWAESYGLRIQKV